MGRSIPKSDGRAIPIPGIPFHSDSFGKPTENRGIMSGPMRKPRGGRRRRDERGSRRGVRGGIMQVTMRDPKTGRMYGGMVKDGIPKFKKPDFVSDEDFKKSFPTIGRRMPPGQRPLRRGEQRFAERLRRDREAGITRTPEEESKLYQEMVSKRKSTKKSSW